MLCILNQQLALGTEGIRIEGDAGDGDGGVGLCGRADAVDFGEDGGDVGAVCDWDFERGAGEDGEGRREGDQGQHFAAGFGGAFAHCGGGWATQAVGERVS